MLQCYKKSKIYSINKPLQNIRIPQYLKMQVVSSQKAKDSQIIQGYYKIKDLSFGSTSMVYRIKAKKINSQSLQQSPQSLQKKQKQKLFRSSEIHIVDYKKHHKSTNSTVIKRFQLQKGLNKTQEQQSNFVQQMKGQCQYSSLQNDANEIYSLKLYNLKKIHASYNEQMKKTMRYNLLTELFLYSKINHKGITKGFKIYYEYKKSPINPINSSISTISTTSTFKNQQKQKQKSLFQLQKLGLILQSNSKGNISAFMNYIDRTKIFKDNKIKIIKFYAAQLVNSLSFLNEKMQVLHRDVKAENIMINQRFQLKIIDFGSAQINQSFLEKIDQNQFRLLKNLVFQQQFQDTQKQKQKQKESKKKLIQDFLKNRQKQKLLIGSKHYISPQMIENTKNQMFFLQLAYKKTDIWSFGVLLYKLFHDRFPFQHKNQKALLENIQNQNVNFEMNPNLPQQVKQIIQKTLKKDYTQRACWNQIKNLSFFDGLDIQNIYEYSSPIYQLLQLQKKLSKQLIKNYQQVHFEQNMLVQNKDSTKIRKVMIITQKLNEKNIKKNKILILKLNNSISQEIILQEKNEEGSQIKTQFFIQGDVLVVCKNNFIYKFKQQKKENVNQLQEETLQQNKIELMMAICQKLTKK